MELAPGSELNDSLVEFRSRISFGLSRVFVSTMMGWFLDEGKVGCHSRVWRFHDRQDAFADLSSAEGGERMRAGPPNPADCGIVSYPPKIAAGKRKRRKSQ